MTQRLRISDLRFYEKIVFMLKFLRIVLFHLSHLTVFILKVRV